MNESHPDFIGPRSPFATLRGLLGTSIPQISMPKGLDLNRPIGVSPSEWAEHKLKLNQKPAAVRVWERKRWAPGTRQDLLVPMSADGLLYVAAADAVIKRMLSGKLPSGAGANTEAVSYALTLSHRLGEDAPYAQFVAHPTLPRPIPVVPFRSGLAELRRARGRSI